MDGDGDLEVLDDRVDEALARAAWDEALQLLHAVETERGLTAPELEQLARAAYGAGDLEAAITAWERLHATHVAAGEHVAAADAATSVAMYLMMDTGLMAPVRSWVARADRLLEGQDECQVHAWLVMVRAYERLLCGDLEGASHWADRVIDVGTRQDVPAPLALGRVVQARLRIFDGRVDEGLALLDDAAIVIMSGDVEPLAVGMVYCELICAMQGLAQYDRAEEWTDAMERWRRDNAIGGISGRCRVHRAEILRLRGSCDAAEDEALHACQELRPWMRREYGWPLTELGTIRLRRGDLAGAEEAFLAAHDNGWEPQPGLALLRLAQGRTSEAAGLIADALDHPVNIPSKERPPHHALRRAPLLEAQVEIALAAGDAVSATAAAAELQRVAERFRSRALQASAVLSRCRVALAEEDVDAAVHAGREAVTIWCDVGAPYEAAVSRMALADGLRASGNGEAAALELRAAMSTFDTIGARRRAQEVVAALRVVADPGSVEVRSGSAAEPGSAVPSSGASAPAPAPGTPTDHGVFRLEGDMRVITFDGEDVFLRDLKGMRYLARMLAEPGREFHVLDLVAAEEGTGRGSDPESVQGLSTSSGGDVGPVLDPQAKAAYHRRLREIDEDIEEATRLGDLDRVALAEADRDYLVAELSRAVGLGGRDRRMGSTSERARASVTRAVRYALERIATHQPRLGEHLGQTVHTGTYCRYEPDPRLGMRWET